LKNSALKDSPKKGNKRARNMNNKKISIKIAISSIALIIIPSMGITKIYGQSTLTNIVYSTDFATSSTGYVWTTNGNGTGLAIDNYYPSYWAAVLNGQDGWVSNQKYNPDTYGPGLNEYCSYYNLNNWTPTFAAFGGDTYNSTTAGYLPSYPQNVTNYWTRSFDNSANSIYFQSKFTINATAPNSSGQWDTFGFTLFNKEANPLFSINFNSVTNNGMYWGISYCTYGHDGVTNQNFIKPNGQQLNTIQNMQLSYLGFDVLNIGQTNQELIMYNNYYTNAQGQSAVILTNSLLGSDYSGIDTNITALAATWQLADKTSTNYMDGTNVETVYPLYANDTLIVENLMIAAPEPKTSFLLALSGIIIILKRNKIKLYI
jgi:hypothetical protein